MASLSDVLNTLTDMVADAVYPNGEMQPSVAGVPVDIFPGWPVRNKLDDTLKAGNAMVSVFPTNKARATKKFPADYQQIAETPATLTAMVIGDTVTIGGTVSTPQAVMTIVNGVGYGYQVLMSDTLTTIAQAIAALIPGASSAGVVITVPGARSLTASITTQYTAAKDISRQERVFLISCWAINPQIRDLLLAPIDEALKENYRIQMPDSFYAHVFPVETPTPFLDTLEKQLVYRGDLEFKIQYTTTKTDTFTKITKTIANVQMVNQIT